MMKRIYFEWIISQYANDIIIERSGQGLTNFLDWISIWSLYQINHTINNFFFLYYSLFPYSNSFIWFRCQSFHILPQLPRPNNINIWTHFPLLKLSPQSTQILVKNCAPNTLSSSISLLKNTTRPTLVSINLCSTSTLSIPDCQATDGTYQRRERSNEDGNGARSGHCDEQRMLGGGGHLLFM